MKIKKNHILTMTIMSLLGISQSAEAVLYAPTTLAGVTRVIEYKDADEQNLFAVNQGLGASLLGQFQAGLQDPKGMVTGSTINGVLVSIVNVGTKVAIAQPQANGTTAYILVNKGTDSAGKAVSALTVANEYLNITSTPGYVAKASLATLIATPGTITKDAPNQATLDLITTSLNSLKTATKQADEKISATNVIAGAATTLGDSATFAVLTDPKAIVEAQVAAQALTTKLDSVALPVINANPAPVTTTAGALTTVVNSPVVQVAATKEAAAASTTVVAAILADPAASPTLKTVGAGVQANNAVAAVSALTNPNLAAAAIAAGVAAPSTTELAAASSSVAASTASLQTQTANLVAAAVTDPTLAAAAAAAQTQLTTTAQSASAAQQTVSTSIVTAANALAASGTATAADLAAAAAATQAATANLATANTAVTASGGTLTAAQIKAQADAAAAAAAAQSATATALATAPGVTLDQIAASKAAQDKAAADLAAANAAAVAAGAISQAQADAAALLAANAAAAANNATNATLSPAALAIVNATAAQATALTTNQPIVTDAATKAAAVTTAKAALDAAIAPASAATQAQKTAALNAYVAATNASQATAAAGKAAADAIVAAKNTYITAQNTYIASLQAAAVPDAVLIAAEQAKLATAQADLVIAQANVTAATASVTAATAALADIATNTAAGGAYVFSVIPTAILQAVTTTAANVATAQAAVAGVTGTTALATAAKANYTTVMADPLSTQVQKDAALANLTAAVQADVAAQNAIITALNAQIAASKAVTTAVGATAAEIAAANAVIATATAAIATANAGILAANGLLPMVAADITAASYAETNKVVSAIGTAAAVNVLAAQAALDAEVLGGTPATVALAAQAFADQLALVKTTQFQAENNGTSGTAGNPASAMSMMIDGAFQEAADFDGSVAASKSNISGASADIGGVNVGMGVGLKYGYYNISGKSVNTVTMPLSVTAKFNPKHQLTLSVPLSYIQTQSQADAYQVGVSAAYRYNVTDNWTLTPAVSYVYRSFDNSQNQYWNPNTSTSLVGGTITSKYTWNFSQMNVSLINMIGHYQSLDSERNTVASLNFGAGNGTVFGNPTGLVTGTAANAALASYIVKNGLHATKMFGNFKVGTYFTDTEFFGSGMYFNQLNEFGFTLKPVNAGKMLDALSIDANYLFSIGGKHSSELDGFRLNLGYKF